MLGLLIVAISAAAHPAPLDLERRVAAHRAVERVLFEHRIWPESNPGPKPAFEDVLPEYALRSRVEDVLRKSNALAAIWKRPIGNVELQAEIDRMVRDSHDPAMLQEMFNAVGRDPVLVAEAIARPALVDRLIRGWYKNDSRFHDAGPESGTFESWWSAESARQPKALVESGAADKIALVLPESARSPNTALCTDDTWTKLGTGAPTARRFHSAVWTGTEMIVWGGTDDYISAMDTGERYNPATDSWSAMSGERAPSARLLHAAVWTGSRMIIWGGSDGNHDLYDGYLYDPATDTWSPMVSGQAPTIHPHGQAVWTGSVMIVWQWTTAYGQPIVGSRYDPSTDTWHPWTLTDAPLGTTIPKAVWAGSSLVMWPGKRYNPVADTWTSIANVGEPSQRTDFTMVWTGSKVVVWGGLANGDWLNDGALYDLATNTWSPMTTTGAPLARDRTAAVWLQNRFVVWGGWNGNLGVYVTTGGRYDPATNSWSPTSMTNVPAGRFFHSTVATSTEMIVWGGGQFDAFNSGGRYNPVTDTWVPTREGAPSVGRWQHSSIWTGAEMIVWGGYSSNTLAKDNEAYSPATDSWRLLSDPSHAAPSTRYRNSAVWTGTEMVIWGGADGNYLGDGSRYNPAIDSWRTVGTAGAPVRRQYHSAVWTGTRMIVWGGESDLGGTLNSGGQYDPVADSWLPMSSSGAPAARIFHGAVWSGSEMIIWGGQIPGGYVNTGGRYNPGTDSWTAMSQSGAPSARQSPGVAWTGARLLVWGGWTGQQPASGGASYDPAANAWSPVSTTGAPSARNAMSTTWTGSELIVWGGFDGNGSTGMLGDGARYLPESDAWKAMSMVDAPRARDGHTGTWTGAKTIVFGGYAGQGVYADGASYCSCLTWYPDADGDGYGANGSAVSVCDGSHPAGTVYRSGDCDDTNPIVHPGAPDASCNGVDNDCDGQIDEDYLAQPSLCGQGPCRAFGSLACVNGQIVNSCVPGTPNSPIDDTCNGIDDDCDGAVDDDFPQREDYWTSIANAPAARTNHTTVWSGSELLVFGGDNGSGTVQTGGIAYVWATNSWRTLAAGPAKRWRHTAVWTGTKMVVWGGDDNVATLYNSGGRYDPSSDSWATTTTTSAPTARFSHTAVWTGSRMIVFGGHDPTAYLNTGAQYDPAGNSWSAITTSGAPAVRAAHTAVWTGSEMIVWGGLTTGQVAVNTGGRYNPSSNTWSPVATAGAPSARYGHAAVWTGSEMLIWGGTTNGTTFLANGARYNPSTDSWTPIANFGAPSLRAFTSFAWTGTELIVWGGAFKTNETPLTALGDGARYNPTTNAWTTMNTDITPPSARARAVGVWIGNQFIVWGGDPNSAALATGGRYFVRIDCGIGACQRAGLTYCSNATIAWECTQGLPSSEICDSIDNDCNGSIDDAIPVPSTRAAVVAGKSGGNVFYSWTPTPNTTGYDIVRGNLGLLRGNGGNFTTAIDACLSNDLRGQTIQDNTSPPIGNGLWYLVRPMNACSGNGTYDDPPPGQIGLRDGEIAASGIACP